MKPYNIEASAPIWNFGPSALSTPVYRRYRSVTIESKSPRINGRLRIRENPLLTEFHEYTSSAGWVWYTGARNTSPVSFSFYSSENSYYKKYYRNDLMELAQNAFIEKASQFATNLVDLFRTRKETIDMVTSKVRSLALAYRNVKRGRWRDVCEILGISYKKPTRKNRSNPPQAWLEYTYGWSPLIGSVYQMINKPFPEPYLEIRETVQKEIGFTLTSTRTAGVLKNDFVTGTYKAVCRGTIVADDAALAAASSYGITNPGLAVWEALPYSFVVDWFLPVGDYLTSLTAFQGISVKSSSVSFTWDFKVTGTSTMDKNHSSKPRDMGIISGSTRYRGCDRIVTVPTFTFKPSNGLSLNRFASALSLLAGEMGRRL